MYKTIGILAHVDAGKTTFSEQILYHTKLLRERGRVDHQNAFLDSHTIEKERGITIFADQVTFTYNDHIYTMIDTPGHVDFSPEMERSLQVLDYAVILINAADGIQGHTETIWNLLHKYNIPTFFFLNKMDLASTEQHNLLQELQQHLSSDIVDMTNYFQGNKTTESLIEWIAERDDKLLEHYLSNQFDQALWNDALQLLIQKREAFPCFAGSALRDEGVLPFLQFFNQFTSTNYDTAKAFEAYVYKIKHAPNGQCLTFLKIRAGQLNVRDEITMNGISEKITDMRLWNGNTSTMIQRAYAGQLVAVSGLTTVQIGDCIGYNGDARTFELVPTLKSKVQFDASLSLKEVIHCFQQLHVEDPSLQLHWDSDVQEIHIHVTGVIQLEILQQLIQERFQLHVTFGDPTILYKETIKSSVFGYGHFEPLGHYAEVHVKLEPLPPNTGIQFASICHPNDLASGYIQAVRETVLHHRVAGILTGQSLTDVKVILCIGRAHNQHTAGGDFREATIRAIRQALEQADNYVIEPFYYFKIKVEQSLIGRVLGHIQQAYGTFEAPETIGEQVLVTGTVPVATFMHYPITFAALTGGKGMLQLIFNGYATCHNQQEVIQQLNYDKNADACFPSSSIFCAKGKGYAVPWYEAKDAMHCPIMVDDK